jgi:hypothetical protein
MRISQKKMTLSEFKASGLTPKYKASQRKYKNTPTFVDDQRFDSKKEAARYQDLKLLEKCGAISNLETQVKFEFPINGEPLRYASNRKVTYVADFTYVEDGQRVVEDVKSKITAQNPAYKLKRALMKACHGIVIRET